MDHSHLLSNLVKRKEMSWVGKFSKMAKVSPDALVFAAGFPNPSTFPFREMTFTLTDGEEFIIDPVLMEECMQYGTPKGYHPLMKQLKTLTERLHQPPKWQDTDIVLVPGSQFGIVKIFEMLINPGDIIILPEPCYIGVFNCLRCFHPQILGVACDSEGMKTDVLEEVLATCKGVPKIMYVNPSGSNPDGTVWSETRRRLIYDIVCQYDIIILEDDPYHLIQFNEEFPPSFLHLDKENRVIRLDSFSKTIGGGLRLGYATGPKDLIDRLTLQVGTSVNHTPWIVQVAVSELMKTIGIDGFLQRAKKTRELYKSLKDIMIKAAETHLQGLCEWSEPVGGFFLWVKVPKVPDTQKMILERAVKKGCLLMPGSVFYIDGEAPCCYLRVSFSQADQQTVNEGFKILAQIIREEIKEAKSIQED